MTNIGHLRKYSLTMTETTPMRWTLRGIREQTREIARLASSNTGLTMGEIVNAAIEKWIQQHPEAMVETDQNVDLDLGEALARVEALLETQARLTGQLFDSVGR